MSKLTTEQRVEILYDSLTTDNPVSYYCNKYNITREYVGTIIFRSKLHNLCNDYLKTPEIWKNLNENNLLSSYGRCMTTNLGKNKHSIRTPQYDRNGYKVITIYGLEKGKRVKITIPIHKLVILVFNMNTLDFNNDTEIIHKDGNIYNNHYSNLRFETKRDIRNRNKPVKKYMSHAESRELFKSDVEIVRTFMNENLRTVDIAKLTGLHQMRVYNCKKYIKNNE